MGTSDLHWVVKIPIPTCPKCDKEGIETVAGLIDRDQITCAFCGNLIDLTSENWRTYFKEAKDALGKLGAAYSKIP